MTDMTPARIRAAKAELRRQMRNVRAAVVDDGLSVRLCRHLTAAIDTSQVSMVMVFDALPGEPDLSDFVDWCVDRGIVTVAPSSDPSAAFPIDPETVDVVIIPGVAFTADGHRLGQGGGWYDRFLARASASTRRIGVCFSEQIIETIPTEEHDVTLDDVVTERGVAAPVRRFARE